MNRKTARHSGAVIISACASLMLAIGCKDKAEDQPASAESAAQDTAAQTTPSTDKPGEQATPARFTVYVNDHELWTGCAADRSGASCPAAQRVAACDGAIDAAALAASLCDMARGAEDASHVAIEVSAPKDARLQRLVTVVDAIGTAGFRRVAMVAPDVMAARLPGDSASPAVAARCGQPAPVCDAPVVVRDVPPAPVAIADQPLLIISLEQIRLEQTVLATVKDFLADPARVMPDIEAALAKARQESGQSSIIVQADKDTVAEVLLPLLDAADAAGFDDVKYAVKRTPGATE